MNKQSTFAGAPHRPVFRSIPPMEWAGELLPGEIRLTALGSRCVLIENYSAIICCTDCCVQLASRCGEVRLAGRNLSLSDVRPGELTVRGFIERIELGAPHA